MSARRTTLVLVVSLVVAFGACGGTGDSTSDLPARPTTPFSSSSSESPTANPTASPSRTPAPTRASPGLARDEQADFALLRPVSKRHALDPDYEPPDLVALHTSLVAPGYPERRLRAEAAEALGAMLAAAGREGLQLRVVSAYRSYEEQELVHGRLAGRHGEAEASRRSAPPGHSEHQLGTTVDVSGPSVQWRLTRQLGETPEGRWLVERAHEFGFALSYPDGAEAVTGYVYEPWHLRYVGVEHATTWRASGLTLIEYLEALDER